MGKTALTIVISDSVRKKLEKRAKKEMQSIEELISDILRKSVLSYKSGTADNVDDKFITFFSRKSRKKSRKEKPAPEYNDSEFNPENFK